MQNNSTIQYESILAQVRARAFGFGVLGVAKWSDLAWAWANSFSLENGISNDGREKDENGKEGLDREGEEKLRQMLLDLTNEMKAKWKIKQDTSR